MYVLADISNESCIKEINGEMSADFLCCYKSIDKIKKACKKYHNSLNINNKNDTVTYKEVSEHNCGRLTYHNSIGEKTGDYIYYVIIKDDLHKITQENFMVKI